MSSNIVDSRKITSDPYKQRSKQNMKWLSELKKYIKKKITKACSTATDKEEELVHENFYNIAYNIIVIIHIPEIFMKMINIIISYGLIKYYLCCTPNDCFIM